MNQDVVLHLLYLCPEVELIELLQDLRLARRRAVCHRRRGSDGPPLDASTRVTSRIPVGSIREVPAKAASFELDIDGHRR